MIVAVLGTGTMGAPIARHLTPRAFREVRAWNRTPERAQPLAEDGVAVVGSVEEAVSGAGAVVTMLADGDAVLEVLDAALPAMDEGAVLVQMSTVGIAATEQIAQRAAERGVVFIDAPVVGTKEPAEKGRLLVLASGPDDAIDRCGGIFEAISVKTLRLGDAGAGTKLKLVVNAWLVSLTQSLAETLVLAERLGLDPRQFLHAISGGPLDVKYAHTKGNAMIERSFEPASFALTLAHKDARLVLDAADGVSLPVVEVVAAQMAAAIESGHGGEDMAATYLASCPAP